MELTFCLGFRNWHHSHLRRCLATIADLRDATGWRAIVVDATPDKADPYVNFLGQCFDTCVIHRPMAEWSRSRALNHAAEVAETSFICCTDADMLFPRAWGSVIGDWWRGGIGHDLHEVWLTHSRDLSPRTMSLLDAPSPSGRDLRCGSRFDVLLRTGRLDAFLLGHSDVHPDVGEGAAMVIPREWLLSIGGFDEVYSVWGGEENDLVIRARWAGLRVAWLPAFVAHQWHRRDWPTPEQIQQVERNRAYLFERIKAGGPIVRNRKVS